MLLLPRSAPVTPPRIFTYTLLRYNCASLPHIVSWASLSQVSTVHFMHTAVRWVRYNAFLSGCQPPWPPPHCLHRANAFALCLAFGRLSHSQVHSSLRPMLTTDRPLAHFRLACRKISTHTHIRSLLASHHPLYRTLLLTRRCPARHFGRNQLPDSSFGLSPLYASHTIELHIRTA